MKMEIESEQLSGSLLENTLQDFSRAMNKCVMASESNIKFSIPYTKAQWWKVKVTIEWTPVRKRKEIC